MTFRTLLARGLTWYWRTNAAVVFGVFIAVAVLTGSLLVGDSVRASLRRMAVERLGRTEAAVAGTHFFRYQLAADVMAADSGRDIAGAVSLIALDAVAIEPSSGRRAGSVQLYGVDQQFWLFHGVDVQGPSGRLAFVSHALAAELGLEEDSALLLRVQQPSAIPSSVLQGRRSEVARALRVNVAATLPGERLGEFSLGSGQAPVRAVFVPLDRVQRELQLEDRANVLLARGDDGETDTAASLDRALATAADAADLGIALEPLEHAHALSLESRAGFVEPAVRQAVERSAADLGLAVAPVLTYIANTIAIGERTIPYSVVSALPVGRGSGSLLTPGPATDVGRGPRSDVARGPARFAGRGPGPASTPSPAEADGGFGEAALPPIWLNDWAARELKARIGELVSLEYYLWSDEEGLTTHRAQFTLAGTVPMDGIGGDRTLTPDYPGMTEAERIGDWEPPFPIDLNRIQPRDERYWDEYRAAPKAFVRYEDGRRLWASRFGDVTSLRVSAPRDRPLDVTRLELMSEVRNALSPAAAGLAAQPVRARALAAAQGSTDFGEYFVYFSFFLFIAGLVLAALFFKLGVESRSAEIGLLTAVGYNDRHIGRLFLAEGAMLGVAGSLAGLMGSIVFCAAILAGLRTWWLGAVGTSQLFLHVEPASLAIGFVAGIVAALATTWLSLRSLRQATARALIGGTALAGAGVHPGRARVLGLTRPLWFAILLSTAAALMVAAVGGALPQTPAFFGAGAALLLAGVIGLSAVLRRQGRRGAIQHRGLGGLLRLGARQTTWRPARTVLVASLIATATFVIVAVGAFRRDGTIDPRLPESGAGGFPLYAESLIPVMHDPGSLDGRAELGFSPDDETTLIGTRVARFRLRPGDEASCLNLYRPTNPRIIAPEPAFLREDRFTFSSSLASSDAERTNPWLILDRRFDDGAVPAIGDATSLAYALHRKVGEDLTIEGPGGQPVVLRIVGALSDSVFQSELIVAESQFVRLFPRREGYRFFLIDAPEAREADVTALLEDRLADLGLDVQETVERIEAYHRVERTYLSTFQTLGGFGLILGTLGLGAVLLRNVLERRRELALLRAVGYRAVHLRAMILAESLMVLGAGVLGGVLAAAVAVMPALWERGEGAGWRDTAVLLAVVVVAGIVSSLAAARAATRAPLLGALRSE